MKKQASPVPTPRAAALSQSANRFSAGATSAWQRIVGNSPRLAATGPRAPGAGPRVPGAARVAAPLSPPAAPRPSRVALESQQAVALVAPAAEPETIRQVGWREVDRAVGVSAKRKYSVFGIKFGPKVPVFETEKVRLPVYQEANRNKQYYAVVKAEDVVRVKREGLQKVAAGKTSSLHQPAQAISHYNSRGYISFFDNKASANAYAIKNMEGNFAIVAFTMPEYQDFTPNSKTNEQTANSGKNQPLHTAQNIPATCIKQITN